MRKLDSSKFFRCCCFLMVLLGHSVYGFAQMALTSNTRMHARSYSYQLPQSTETKVLLKDALDNLKKQFNVRIAYQEGLLDNKFVPASLSANSKLLSLDDNLKQLLTIFQLEYRKINDNQISIFAARDVQANPIVAAVVLTGKVTDAADGQPVVGASVYLKADNKVGTTTDVSGNFKLLVPDKYSGGALTLTVVYMGYSQQDVPVASPASPIQIKLAQNNKALNEVVVTALGISKQKKSLGYSVTEVKGTEFTQARENNVANALTGKIAGVNATGLSTGPGGSSRVVIRGNGGLSGSNQPLYVVNGMPIDNSVPGGAPTVNGSTNNVDRGDGIAAINPDDIESISVLKGGTAAALYGSRAANGVILITTKKGKAQQGIGIEFNSTATYDNASVFPDFQYEYGQGDNGVKPTTLAQAQTTGRRSWGAKIDGSTDYVAVDGKTHPYVAQKNNIKNFYQTGATYTNSIAFVGGNEAFTYRFSAADLSSKGVLPGTTYDRKTFNLALNGKLSKHIAIEALAQYNIENGHNRTGAGDALGNPNWTPLEVANTVDVRWLKPGYDDKGNEIMWNDASIASNGYFVINKFKEDDQKNRFIGQGSVIFTPIDNLTFKATVSRDFFNYNYTNILPTGALYMLNGAYAGYKSDVSETNELVTASYKTKIVSDFNVNVLAGVNSRRNVTNELNLTGDTFTIPYFYSFTNLSKSSTTPNNFQIVTNSVFGAADFDFKSLAFLSFTGRKDWFSTLSLKDNSIFYPSVGGSFILSDAIKLPQAINLFKLRGSWAQVGGGAPDPYVINLSYASVPSAGPPLQNVKSPNITNPNLKPYTSTTFEGGFELQMLNNRLGFDVTLYNRKTTNDIVKTSISTTSGYSSVILNVGEVSNKGVELLITGNPIKSKDFAWNVSYNAAYNNNKVLKLAPGLSTIQMASSVNGYAYLNNIVGKPFGTLVGTSMTRDANGNVVFDPTTGYPVPTALHEFGKSVAPLTMGLTNEFRYKRFSLNVLLDGKFGNKVFSLMEVYATRLGLMKSTLPGRDGGLTVTGVDKSGNPYTRTVPVSGLRTYYDNYKIYSDLFLHDGSFVKLRQVILSYNIPPIDLKAVRIRSASVSLVARNLLTIYKKTDNFDPEQTLTNSESQGFESIGLPRTRSIGVNLAVKF
ncbi:SusC/RagA family TonB-linked outer membrane protein [Mucilaginibacter sp. CAU 1740]|uniref:SusC/RagA family TonB-linked outer membrane protein n=1 Tax=Mucilaginibacter sp. CAU 1740 TaxID=3140365 RepID=UPI00325A4844